MFQLELPKAQDSSFSYSEQSKQTSHSSKMADPPHTPKQSSIFPEQSHAPSAIPVLQPHN